jgi:hypothetical protein
MKIFHVFGIFWITFAVCCSLEDTFQSLIDISETISASYRYNDEFLIDLVRNQFEENMKKVLSENSAIKVIQKFSEVCSDKPHFFLMFWFNYQRDPKHTVFYSSIDKSDISEWNVAILNLFIYVLQNFWLSSQEDLVTLGQLITDLYNIKLKRLLWQLFTPKDSNDLIGMNLTFNYIERVIASNFYQFQIPNEICSSILHVYSRIQADPSNEKLKIKLFNLIKKYIKETGPYEILIWLDNQTPQFKRYFLFLSQAKYTNTLQNIDQESSDRFILIEGLKTFFPIFKECLNGL